MESVNDPDRRYFLVVLMMNTVNIYPDCSVDKTRYFQVKKLISLANMLTDSSVGQDNWSERSACAALGCWHKRKWPLFLIFLPSSAQAPAPAGLS